MKEKDTLADKISNTTEELSTSLVKTYSEKGIGYIKLLAIIGTALPIFLALVGDEVGTFVLILSFILVLLAMKRVDQITTSTKSFKYMTISFIAFIIFSSVYLFSLAAFVSGWNYSTSTLFSRYLPSTIVVILTAIVSTYYYYKSYVELSIATHLNIFKIAAIMMIVSAFIGIISDTLSSLLVLISIVFTIIGWISIKRIGSEEEIENKEDI